MSLAPDDWRVRLTHGLASLAASALRPRYGGPIEQAVEPEGRPVARLNTLAWGEVTGDALPTLLLHGINANARYWTGVASRLSRHGRRVLALDLRGHGATGPLSGGYTLEAMRDDLLAWLDALQIQQVDLVGHSMGGKVAADLAAAHPRRVRRLALADPVPPEGLHAFFDHVAALRRAVFAPERGPFTGAGQLAAAHRTISWLRHADPWMHRAFDANFFTQGDGTIHPVLDDAAYQQLFQGVLCCPSPLPLSTVTMPVLLIRATFSVMPFGRQVRRLKRDLPQLEVQRLPGEHSLHATNPVGLADAVGRFLDR